MPHLLSLLLPTGWWIHGFICYTVCIAQRLKLKYRLTLRCGVDFIAHPPRSHAATVIGVDIVYIPESTVRCGCLNFPSLLAVHCNYQRVGICYFEE